MKTLRTLLVPLALLALAAGCQPEPEIPDPAVEAVDLSATVETVPSAARIHLIAQSCAACHGTAGSLQTLIPAIAGTPAAILEMQLLAFRDDVMPGATVMPRLTKGYTEAEIRALAAHFAAIDRLAERSGASQ